MYMYIYIYIYIKDLLGLFPCLNILLLCRWSTFFKGLGRSADFDLHITRLFRALQVVDGGR